MYNFKIAKSSIRMFAMARNFDISMLQEMLKPPLKGLISSDMTVRVRKYVSKDHLRLCLFFPAMIS